MSKVKDSGMGTAVSANFGEKVRQTFRFPLPPVAVAALLIMVAFAFGHSLYTQHMVKELMASSGMLDSDPRTYVTAMFGGTVVLTLFVVVMLLNRGKLALVVEPHSLVVERLRPTAAGRRVELPWDAVIRVDVDTNARGQWKLVVDTGRQRYRFPMDNVVSQSGERPGRIKDSKEALAHPLVVALQERLGERLVVKR